MAKDARIAVFAFNQPAGRNSANDEPHNTTGTTIIRKHLCMGERFSRVHIYGSLRVTYTIRHWWKVQCVVRVRRSRRQSTCPESADRFRLASLNIQNEAFNVGRLLLSNPALGASSSCIYRSHESHNMSRICCPHGVVCIPHSPHL